MGKTAEIVFKTSLILFLIANVWADQDVEGDLNVTGSITTQNTPKVESADSVAVISGKKICVLPKDSLKGLKGDKGDPGTSVKILGSFSDSTQLPTSGNTAGDGYLINGHLWVWRGTFWANVGNIQGPQGETGPNQVTSSTTTNITGILKGNGSTVSSAVAGTDYQEPITGAATTITNSNLTGSRAIVSNSSGKIAVSTVTSTELGYLSGVTSGLQNQIDGKEPSITGSTADKVLNGAKEFVSLSTSMISDFLSVVKNAISATGAIIYNSATGVISHQTGDGYHHVQATGTNHNGMFYHAGATAGSDAWYQPTTSDIPEGSYLYFTNTRAQSAITGGASSVVTSNLSTNKALISDASGKIAASSTSNTELGYLSGVTSSIQSQFSTKEPVISIGTTNQFYSWNKTWQLIAWAMITGKPDLYIKSEIDALLSGKQPLNSQLTAISNLGSLSYKCTYFGKSDGSLEGRRIVNDDVLGLTDSLNKKLNIVDTNKLAQKTHDHGIGTINKLTKFVNSTGVIGNSIISDNGSVISFGGTLQLPNTSDTAKNVQSLNSVPGRAVPQYIGNWRSSNYWGIGQTGADDHIIQLGEANPSGSFVLGSTTHLKVGTNTVWDLNNDGSNSGLDADLLDGLHASNFALATSLSNYFTKTEIGTSVNTSTLYTNNIAKKTNGSAIEINSGHDGTLGLKVYNDMKLYNTLEFTDQNWVKMQRMYGSATGIHFQTGAEDEYLLVSPTVFKYNDNEVWTAENLPITVNDNGGYPIIVSPYGFMTAGGGAEIDGNGDVRGGHFSCSSISILGNDFDPSTKADASSVYTKTELTNGNTNLTLAQIVANSLWLNNGDLTLASSSSGHSIKGANSTYGISLKEYSGSSCSIDLYEGAIHLNGPLQGNVEYGSGAKPILKSGATIELNSATTYYLNVTAPRYKVVAGNANCKITMGAGTDGQRVTITRVNTSGPGISFGVWWGVSNATGSDSGTISVRAGRSQDFIYDASLGGWTLVGVN